MASRDSSILNKTTKTSNRYRIMRGSMGNFGDPQDSPQHTWHVAIGNNSPGFSGMMSIEHTLKTDYIPKEVKVNLVAFLLKERYRLPT